MNKILIIFSALLSAVLILTGCGGTTASPTPTGTAMKLVFTSQPSGATAGVAFDPQPVLAATDLDGKIITSYMGLVILTIKNGPADAHLFGATKVSLVNGVAKFKDVYLDRVSTDYTLTATCNKLTPAIGQIFTVSPGAAGMLAFTTQPSGGVAGLPFKTQPVVAVQDLFGNTVTSYQGSVTIDIPSASGPHGAVVSGTPTVQVVNNIARFTNLSIDKAYPEYTLTATSGNLVSATSENFQVTAADPTKLQFTVQPAGAVAGTPFETQPKVAIMDKYGNVVLTAKPPVTVSLTPGTGTAGAMLSGNTTILAEGGMGGGLAEYEDLAINRAGTGYTLTAVSTGFTSTTSDPFNVAAP